MWARAGLHSYMHAGGVSGVVNACVCSLLLRFVEDVFDEDLGPTIGACAHVQARMYGCE